MFADLKPYGAYTAAELPWLARIPAGWALQRAKTVLTSIDVRSVDGSEPKLTVSSNHGVIPRAGATVTMFEATDYSGHKLCERGDLVINSLWAWSGGLGVSPLAGIVSTAYGVYRVRDPRATKPWFLHQLVRSQPFQWELQVRSRGIWISRLQLTDDQFLGAPLPLPPPAEQAAIVKYLAHADARISKAIAAKRRLIALLHEEKQAVINQAVTKGLDPSVPMKDSGLPWLGKVPRHWQLRKLRALFNGQGSGTTPSNPGDYGGSTAWIMSGDLNDYVVTSTSRSVYHSAITNIPSLKVYPPGSLVVAMYGATIGKTGILGVDAATNQACCVFYGPRSTTDTGFMQLAVRAMRAGLLVTAFGGGQPNVNAERVCQLRVPVPPLDEQRKIVGRAHRAMSVAQSAIQRASREIDLLREFRTRLTADVVTGQVDVRQIAASLPDIDPADTDKTVAADPDVDDLPDEAAAYLGDDDVTERNEHEPLDVTY
jgi:type I restriction enzyme S subunit